MPTPVLLPFYWCFSPGRGFQASWRSPWLRAPPPVSPAAPCIRIGRRCFFASFSIPFDLCSFPAWTPISPFSPRCLHFCDFHANLLTPGARFVITRLAQFLVVLSSCNACRCQPAPRLPTTYLPTLALMQTVFVLLWAFIYPSSVVPWRPCPLLTDTETRALSPS